MPILVCRDASISASGLRQQNATTYYGQSASTEIPISAENASRCIRGVYKWGELVPPGGAVTVNSATITLFNKYNTADPARTVEIRKLNLAFNNSTVTSWNNRTTATPWNVAGVLGGTDVDATPIATGTMPNTISTSFNLTGAGLITYCQAVLNGAADNGVLINLLDDITVNETSARYFAGPSEATAVRRPTLTVDYSIGSPVNWTINSPTVNSDAGTVTLTVTLDAPAPGGGFSGLVNTYDITAVAGVDYTAQVDVPFSISAGNTTGNIVIPILP